MLVPGAYLRYRLEPLQEWQWVYFTFTLRKRRHLVDVAWGGTCTVVTFPVYYSLVITDYGIEIPYGTRTVLFAFCGECYSYFNNFSF